ncbi:MAG: histidine--tRNA ligase [Candidatus Pacebacteria bacterium]|nr:histidine--tRNA ligase [Candidatus Paceibacterota bacterium]MDD3728721.1 histidine--tRNA ligase [Candidatus Paceibacterota bacterium]MDD5445715.1 histidine--tRNA ligase [Candidatus Paceibacterota bacterium]
MEKMKFQSVTGMHDILPETQKYFKKIYETVSIIADFYNFGKIDTPLLESAELFSKGVGENTDIVEKEMYTLKTKKGEVLALRPEWTAPIGRAYIEHGMHNRPQPLKLWYFGPCFRHENPQAGRYRQFWQFGFEIFGEKEAIVDAQIIQIFYNILKELKIKDVVVDINSIGDNQCRGYYKKTLSKFFRSKEGYLCSDCKRRIKGNILRVLDCKNEKCEDLKGEAPQILDYLCDECKNHFKEVLEFLDELNIPYSLNSSLVRGLDYYTKTVFEMVQKENKKIALAGGGRYDVLIKMLGGRDVPACGAAAGVERLIEIMKSEKLEGESKKSVSVFVAQLGNLAKRKGLYLFEELRKAKIKTGESFGKDSLRSQLARADRLGARYTAIIGQKEALENMVMLRDMKTGKQDEVSFEKAALEIKERLKKEK